MLLGSTSAANLKKMLLHLIEVVKIQNGLPTSQYVPFERLPK
jgi:hypothetical protein